jgi:hypothetical protein
MKGRFVIFRNNLNGFWDFYHGINMVAGSPKALTRMVSFNPFLNLEGHIPSL